MREHTAENDVTEALTKALHEAETSGGWWGHHECEEFARIITPTVERIVSDARASALASVDAFIDGLAPTYATGTQAGKALRTFLKLMTESRVTPPGQDSTENGIDVPHAIPPGGAA